MGVKACKVHENFFHTAGAVAQMVEQQKTTFRFRQRKFL